MILKDYFYYCCLGRYKTYKKTSEKIVIDYTKHNYPPYNQNLYYVDVYAY